MGSGKTTVGELLAELAAMSFLDLDRMIEARQGLPVAEIFEREGERAFRLLEAELLPSALREGTVVALGGGAPLSDTNWDLIRDRAISVHLALPFEQVWERLRTDASSRPLLRGRAEPEIRKLFEARLARYREADLQVDANRLPEVLARDILERW